VTIMKWLVDGSLDNNTEGHLGKIML